MRNLKFVLAIITVVIIAFTSLSHLNSQNNPNLKNGFYLGPMSHYYLNVLQRDSHNKWYQELSYNMMQSYCGHFDTIADTFQNIGQKDGGFFEDTGNYVQEMNQVIQNWHDIASDNSLIFEREKILRPCYGQRFTYQAEYPGTWHTKFPAYGYDSTDVTGEDESDSNGISKHCMVGRDSPGFMVKGLYENCSQTNDVRRDPNDVNSSSWRRLYSDIKQQKYGMRWFIKPRIRVDVNTLFSHLNDTLFKIYVKNFEGRFIDSFAIKGRNFLDSNSSYDGRYLENYYNLPTVYHNLSVLADSLVIGRKDGDSLTLLSKVDYQVKWLGKVDVWLDYVRVDDSWAHYLFTDTWVQGQTYPPNNMWHFRERIKQEVYIFENTPGLGYFWVDEVQFANLECIGEVNRLVREYSGNKLSLLFITDPVAFMGWSGLRHQDPWNDNDYSWDTCINIALRCGALRDIMVTQWFPINYTRRYPTNLSITASSDSFPGTNYFKKADNYTQYTEDENYGIQSIINKRLKQHRFYIQKAADNNLIYSVINQINSDENGIQSSGNDWGIREPTNAEISLILNTSFAYGAKVLFEFSYTTRRGDTDGIGYRYNMGLTSSDKNDYSSKRYLNYYGETKWNYVRDLNKKIMAIANIMYPPGNEESQMTYDKTITVNTLNYTCTGCGLPYYYISDIKSIYSNASYNFDEEPSCINCDPTNKRYWEIGFFNNPLNSNDKSKYFLALNKRTYPEISSDGDLRHLKVKFNTSSLQGYNNWVLKDAVKDSVLSVFNKETNDYVSASIFLPGEGKLLKLAPVIQEGGTFVCDETVSTSTFTCNGTVFNNGYDLIISPNTTITFSNDAGIEMNGGSFECGEYSTKDNMVTFNGTDSSKGLVLKNCSNVGIYNTNINNLKNDSSETAVFISNTYDINMKGCVFNAAANSGGVNISFTVELQDSLSLNVSECIFMMGSSGCDALSISSNGSPSAAVLLDWCTFTTSNDSSNALRLINVTGGAVKNSTFVNFNTTISALGSAFDLYNNKILGKTNSTGIQCLSSSSLSMKPISGNYLGGYNYIKNYGTSSSCINVNNSYFDINLVNL